MKYKKSLILATAELINGETLNRRLNQSEGALSPICLKQNSLPAHHYPVIKVCQLKSGLNKKLSTFFRTRHNSKFLTFSPAPLSLTAPSHF